MKHWDQVAKIKRLKSIRSNYNRKQNHIYNLYTRNKQKKTLNIYKKKKNKYIYIYDIDIW